MVWINTAEGANMGDKEEIKSNIPEGVVREKDTSERNLTGAKDLLSAMGATSNEDAKPQAKKPYKIRWPQFLLACCCLLAITAVIKGFLYLDNEITAVAKDLSTLKARMTAAPDTKEQLAAVTAEIEHLKTTNTQLRAEVKKIRDTLEAAKTRKNNVVPAQQKRGRQPRSKKQHA